MVYLRNFLNHNFEQDKNNDLRNTNVCKREQEVLEIK